MDVLVKQDGETWRECLGRIAEQAGAGDDPEFAASALADFDAIVAQGTDPLGNRIPEADAAWDVALAYGLIGSIGADEPDPDLDAPDGWWDGILNDDLAAAPDDACADGAGPAAGTQGAVD